MGYGDAVVLGTSRHSLLGYEALKEPFFGSGVCAMEILQLSRSLACSALFV
jgi:hypothetical protein